MVLESSVMAECAYSPPPTVALVATEIPAPARILPSNATVVPMRAEVPGIQYMLQAVEPLVRMTWEPAMTVTAACRSRVSKCFQKTRNLTLRCEGEKKGALTGARDLEHVVSCARQVYRALEHEGAVEVVDAGSEGQASDIGEPGALVSRGKGLGLRVRRAEVGVGIDGGRGAGAYVLVSVDNSGRESGWGWNFGRDAGKYYAKNCEGHGTIKKMDAYQFR